MERKIKHTPPRLSRVFDRYNPPLYFITACTLARRPILACPQVHEALRDYGVRGRRLGVAIGRYVIMPDHFHVFVRTGGNVTVGRWVRGLRRHLDRVLESLGHETVSVSGSKLRSFWQPGVWDHLLRSGESYAEKWGYVRNNPVRAKLVKSIDDWPYQGEVDIIDRV